MSIWKFFLSFFACFPFGIELVFHTENSMKYRSLHTILKYRFNIPFRYEIPIFCTWKIKFGMLKRYLRIVCKDRYFKISCWFDNFYCRFLTIFTLSLFVTIFLVDLTKMMSGQNQGTKLSIWRAIWSFCKVDFLVWRSSIFFLWICHCTNFRPKIFIWNTFLKCKPCTLRIWAISGSVTTLSLFQ